MTRPTDRTRLAAALAACALFGSAALAAGAVSAWPSFRGDRALSGEAGSALPTSLEPLWTFRAGTGIEATAAIHADTVFVASLDGDLHALDFKTGAARWTYRAGDAVRSSPAVEGGTVYFGDAKGVFHAVDARTGRRKWTFQTGGEIISSANFAAGRVLFGSYDNFLYCLDAADGTLRWKVETAGYVHATPAVVEEEGSPAVLSAGCDGRLRLVRVDDGREIRSAPLGGYAAASPAVRGGRAFIGTFENRVLAVDIATARVVWTYAPEDRQFPFYASAAVRDAVLVVGGRDKRVHALRPADGKPLWTFAARGRIDASPVLAGDRAVIGTTSGEIVALDLRTGEPSWQFDTGSSIVASPAVAAGRLVIGTTDGLLYCFGAGS